MHLNVKAARSHIGWRTAISRRSRRWLGIAVGLSVMAVGLAGGQEPTCPVCVVPAAPNINIAVVRLNVDGTIDPTFGEGGVRQLDLGPNTENIGDLAWGVKRDAQDRLLLFGAAKGEGARVDRDRVVIRLTAAGAVDTTFATEGMHTLDIATLNDNARHGTILPDGKIISGGYTSQPTGVGTQQANAAVLLRLNDDGTPDETFGYLGVVNINPFTSGSPIIPWGFPEVYGVVQQASGHYVTTGYGRTTGDGALDMVALRFNPDGSLDPTWGTNGAVLYDFAGGNDRGRNIMALPDGRIFITGTATQASAVEDAMVIVLNPDGTFDASFDGDGVKTYDFGGSDEEFYGAALSPNNDLIAAAGYSAGDNIDDDATLLLLSQTGEIVQLVPLSDVENDRFWSVTIDTSNRIYAAGFMVIGGDSHMIVARFNPDGALDPSFGVGGVAAVNLIAAGTEEVARDITLQSDGKIVIAGMVEAEAAMP